MSHQLGADYSIVQKLRQEITDEATDSMANDILQQNQRFKTIYEKEDDYHKKRLTTIDNKDFVMKRPLPTHSSDTQTILPKKKRISRWDLQTYEVPEQSSEMQKELEESVPLEEAASHNLRFLKPSDREHFSEALQKHEEDDMTKEEKKEKLLVGLLLRIKNGNTASRKISMRTLTERAVDFGPNLIFDRVLPLFLDKTLEDQERHLMIKIIDRVLYKLGDLVRPYTQNIIKVTGPLLIDEDPVARATGRDIITNVSIAAGFASMVTAVRPDIEHDDEYIRNITSRVVAVAAKALGIPRMIPFINAVCHSKKSWKARHTGARIVQQIAIIMGIGVLPSLEGLIKCIAGGLTDEHIPIRTVTANALSALANNSYPYGIESFNIILEPLWKGIRSHRGKLLSSFLKCIGSLIPLMNPEYAGYYTQEVMKIVQREFSSPDEDMKRTVLIVLQKCSKTEGVTPKYLRENVAPDFFKHFWIRRTSLDRQMNKLVTFTTVVLSEKLGCAYTIENLLKPLRDEAEPFRTMSVHAVSRIVKLLGTNDLNERQENRLIDALLIAFQEQTSNDSIVFKGFATVAMSLGVRMKPYISPIISTILNHLRHRTPLVREHAADLCGMLIPVIKDCEEFELLNKLNIILFESLGEVYPDVLGSIIGAMYQIIIVIEFSKLQPSVNQILPTLTPILRNNHRKVQFNTITLVGKIADCGPEYVPPKEWMRICFELLEMLKSTNKGIRRAANKTFGHIAKAIGPNDVLSALLNNLKVQERQLRVCTAVAIGIVAKVCGSYTVLPVLMNEYKTPETNVQNGVLKAMTFMFEYIGELSQDYIYFMLPLLEDALTDRDLVHRQTAADVLKHLALHCEGLGYEDAFIHLLNLLMPNIFETSPHVITRILDGLEGLGIAVGPGVITSYIWAGLFHPAKNVRKAFWKLYNKIYIQKVDSLVPYYPATTLDIDELDIVL